MATVELSGLVKSFGEQRVVDQIDLAILEGELLVLVGPSGCGKTTTLRMIAGLETPDAGEIRIGDRVVNRVTPRDRDVAMVFQNYALYPHMTVRKNLGFGLRMRRIPRREVTERVAAVAELLEIGELLDRKPSELSGGQQQRVALGRAIVREPAVFLLDEPLSNLDAKLRATMRTELVRLHQQIGTTMVHVTHDQTEAMMMGDRIVVMHQGRIEQAGPPLEVYRYPATRFVAEFVGSPPMNFFDGTLDEEGLQVGTARLAWPAAAAAEAGTRARPVAVGLRPEEIAVNADDADNADNAVSRDGTWRGEAEVELVQPMGAETLLQCRWESSRVTVALRNLAPPGRGERVTLSADRDALHLFDAGTGQRVGPPPRSG